MLAPAADADGTLLAVRVTARASRERLAGERAGRLLVHVTAPPLDGRANAAICRLLAKSLGVSTGRVRIVSGERARDKLVRVDGLTPAATAQRLGVDR